MERRKKLKKTNKLTEQWQNQLANDGKKIKKENSPQSNIQFKCIIIHCNYFCMKWNCCCYCCRFFSFDPGWVRSCARLSSLLKILCNVIEHIINNYFHMEQFFSVFLGWWYGYFNGFKVATADTLGSFF